MYLKKRNHLPEIITLALLIGILSYWASPDFKISGALVFILASSMLISFWHGRFSAFILLILSFLIYTLGRYFFQNTQIPKIPEILAIFCMGAVFIYMGGAIRQFRLYKMDKVMRRYRRTSDQNSKMNKISRAQQEIIRELEERVTRQKTSLNLLYERIHDIDCLDFNLSISKLIDTLAHFTDAGNLSLWVYDPSLNKLKLRMSKGDDSGSFEGKESLDLQDSIEGWVFRNNQLFSIRMSLDYDSFDKLNTENSIISVPIVLDNKTWGVINIDDLPFIKYSVYTENLIQIIISLAQPALKKAMDFETLLLGEEEHEVTGLPQFTQLYRILDKNRYDESGTYNSSSLILLELQEYSELSNTYSSERILKLFAEILKELAEQTANRAELFHYRQDSRMALFVPHMDFDGCSLFSLESLQFINQKTWNLDGKLISPEINLGYASSGTNEKMEPDELLKRAEYLLEIQQL